MRFIVHVIDEASKFILIDGQYFVETSVSEKQEECDIQRSDCFYDVEASDAAEAVVNIAQRVKILDEDDQPVNLALKLAENYKKIQSAEIGPDGPRLLDPVDLVVSNTTHSSVTTTMCQVNRTGKDGGWIESHKIFFYVLPINKIIDLKG